MFVAYLNNEIVAMCSVISFPNGAIKNAFRIHRLVVLPDYQGLGIGIALLEEICKLYKRNGLLMYIRTSHLKLYNHFKKTIEWAETGRSGQISPSQQKEMNWKVFSNRTAYSFRYDGNGLSSLSLDLSCYKKIEKQDEKEEQMSIFDYINASNS